MNKIPIPIARANVSNSLQYNTHQNYERIEGKRWKEGKGGKERWDGTGTEKETMQNSQSVSIDWWADKNPPFLFGTERLKKKSDHPMSVPLPRGGVIGLKKP